jgi:hypothetical protein
VPGGDQLLPDERMLLTHRRLATRTAGGRSSTLNTGSRHRGIHSLLDAVPIEGYW